MGTYGWVLIATILVVQALPVAADHDPICAAYSKAAEIHEREMARVKPTGMLGAISENLLGPPKHVEEARQAAGLKLYRSYKRAYRGPLGIEEKYTAMLISSDVTRCMLDHIMDDVEADMEAMGLELEKDEEDDETLVDIFETLGLIQKP